MRKGVVQIKKQKDRFYWYIGIVVLVALFMFSNHMMDLGSNSKLATNGFWTVYDMDKLYHGAWYSSYAIFFMSILLNIYLIEGGNSNAIKNKYSKSNK